MHYGLPLDFCEIVSPFIQIFRWNTNISGWIFNQRDLEVTCGVDEHKKIKKYDAIK